MPALQALVGATALGFASYCLTLASLPAYAVAGGTAATTAGGWLISAGGEAPTGTIADVDAYRPGAGAWTRLPDLPTPRHGLALAAVAGRVYAIAGGPLPGLHVSTANEFLANAGGVAGKARDPSMRQR
jgi:hypothetical protein